MRDYKPLTGGGRPETAENEDGSDQLIFYYNREKRLAKAPENVRSWYEKGQQIPKKKRFGLITCLFDTRPKAFLFISIVAFCLAVLLKTYFL
jgi:hypothetical protein